MENGSWIRKMFEEGIALKQKHGEQNVYDLSLGNPIVEPPKEFFDELKKVIRNPKPGMHRYMPNAGYEHTRTAVAQQLETRTGLPFSADHILMTCGTGGALNVIMKTILDPGDEVVIFAPYFVEYLFYADNHGSSCHIVPPDDQFLPDFEYLESCIGPKTRMVLINSPNNPSGVVYNSDILDKIARLICLKEREYGTEIFLVSDEPYRHITFDDTVCPYVFDHHPRSIVATSHSKDLALPGERIGFVAINPHYECRNELMDGLTFSNRTLGFVNAPALMQQLVSRLQTVSIDVGQYQNKRDYLYENLVDMGYSVVKPQGAFYMFPKSPVKDDTAFVEELQRHRVLVVPGSGFGVPGHFRIAYCVTHETLQGSLNGFRKALKS